MKFLFLSCLLLASSAFAQSNLRIRLYDDLSLKGLMNGIEKKYEVIRELQKVLKRTNAQKITIFAHPEVSAKLSSEDFGIIEALEEAHNKTLLVRADNNYHAEQYEIYAPEN